MARTFNLIERVNAWERRLIAAFATAPVAEVLGLVDKDGVEGSHDVDGVWNIEFSCPAWRIDGSRIRKRSIALRYPAPPNEFGAWRRKVRPQSIVRCRAHVVDNRSLGIAQAFVKSFLAAGHDSGLSDCVNRAAIPSVLIDETFGGFVASAGRDSCDAVADWGDQPVRLYLDGTTKRALGHALAAAHELWRQRRIWNRRISTRVLRKFLQLKNEHWLADGEEPVSVSEFLERVTVEHINVEPNGEFEFWHHDGALFLNHAIVVHGSLTKGITDATLEG